MTYSIEELGPYLNGDERNPFYLHLLEGGKITDSLHQNGAMNQLEKLEDGNVAEIFFSLRTLKSPEQVLKLLSDYDVRVANMAVYAGELKAFKPGNYSSSSAGHTIPILH